MAKFENFTPQEANEAHSNVFQAVFDEVENSKKRWLGMLSWQTSVNKLKKLKAAKKGSSRKIN